MKMIFYVTLAVLLPSLALAAGPNLNLEYGDISYQPWSVFSPDYPDPSQYKKNVIIYFHGFASAVPNGTYKKIRKKFKRTHTVLGVNYEYFKTKDTMARLDAFYERALKGRSVVVFGTSLGGFWANYFGNKIEAEKIVLLNPMISPEKDLIKKAGNTHLSPRRKIEFAVTKADVEAYGLVKPVTDPLTQRLVVLTKDDEMLDHTVALKRYSDHRNTRVELYDTGGHTIDLRKHAALDAIGKFVWGK